MGVPYSYNKLKLRGKLVKDPTDLSAVYPHGGTELGVIHEMIFSPNIKTSYVRAWEFGNTKVEGVYAGEGAVIGCTLKEFDSDALGAVFPNVSGTTIRGIASATSANFPGYLLSNKSMVLLFSPHATTNHPAILIYKAIPEVEETMRIQMHRKFYLGMPVIFSALPNTAGLSYEVGLLSNLTGAI